MTPKERILDLAEKIKNPPSWWWKVLGGLIFLVMAIWIRYLLSKRSEALAALKTEADKKKLAAAAAAVAAKVEKDVVKRKAAEAAAFAAMSAANADRANIEKLESEHKKHVAQLQAVKDKDWDALNKLAGVQP
jgi:4-amino-4-deoxy-L-arabinose transferase-like glycosyltransferase